MRTTISAAALLAACVLAGCAPAIEVPPGFVAVPDADGDLHSMRAVSAGGVALGVRRHDNPAHGTLAFWAEAVRNELESARGYKPGKDQPLESRSGTPGTLLTFSVAKSGTEFSYLVAVYVTKRWVTLVEAGGKAEAVKPKLKAIQDAMRTVR